MKTDRVSGFLTALAALAFMALAPSPAPAHCDGMDGPVVKAARQALNTGNVNLVLIWVQPADETELRKAFARIMAVRAVSPEVKELADLYFFETLVRLHRAGEGEPYTGLKPGGRDLGPVIPAADRAIDNGSAGALVKMVSEATAAGIQERFRKALATRAFRTDDVQAGREHVKAYVEFLHYVEALHAAARGSGHEHSREASKAGAGHPH